MKRTSEMFRVRKNNKISGSLRKKKVIKYRAVYVEKEKIIKYYDVVETINFFK